MIRRTAEHLSSQRGFSLVELMVAVAIFGVLAALGLPHLDTKRQDIQTATKQIIADYRWARNRAITSGVHFGIEWNSTNSYQVHKMKQVGTTWSKDIMVKSVTLPTNINASWSWPAAMQEFNTRGMMVTTTYPIYQLFWDSKYYGWHMVSLWPSGQIYEEY